MMLIFTEPNARRKVVTTEVGTAKEKELEARLTAQGNQTRLIIEERGIPLEGISGYGGGWTVHVEDLGRYLDGREPNNLIVRWDELSPWYEQMAKQMGAS